jgi:hypothetical protein
MQLDIKLYAVASLKDKRSVTRRLQGICSIGLRFLLRKRTFRIFKIAWDWALQRPAAAAELWKPVQTIENHLAADPELEILNVSREILTV